MSSKGITVLLHLMKKLIRSDRCFSKVPFHYIVIIQLRSGLQASWKEKHRLIYHYTFDFPVGKKKKKIPVGVYPNKQGGLFETNTIKIVCNYSICRKCNRHWPSTVVTIYPCMKPFIWIRSTAKNIVSFSIVGCEVFKLAKEKDKKPQRQRLVEWNLCLLKIPSYCLLAKWWLLHNGLQLLVIDWFISYWLLTTLLWVRKLHYFLTIINFSIKIKSNLKNFFLLFNSAQLTIENKTPVSINELKLKIRNY